MKAKVFYSTTKNLKPNAAKKYGAKHKPSSHGTKEWADKTVNCCTGCSHDCIYCYAKSMAIRFKRLTAAEWPSECIRWHDVHRRHKKYVGRVMFPSSHDITPTNLAACLIVLEKLLAAGNEVLIVSKPHLECIRTICDTFNRYRNLFEEVDGQHRYRMVFRFTIGATDDRILSYWEPNAPTYEERKAALKYAYKAGFQTSVSVEPMLDSPNIDILISELSPYVTHSIWIGKMNHLGRFEKGADMVLKQAVKRIRQGQACSIINSIRDRYKNNPLIKFKKGT
jgi:DNA repair photolyase